MVNPAKVDPAYMMQERKTESVRVHGEWASVILMRWKRAVTAAMIRIASRPDQP